MESWGEEAPPFVLNVGGWRIPSVALLEATTDLGRERNLGLKMACVRIRFCRNTEERQRSLRPLSLLHLPPCPHTHSWGEGTGWAFPILFQVS